MWTVIAIIFQVFLLFMVGREVFEERKDLGAILIKIIKSPMAEPFATWLIVYTCSFVVGGVAIGMGFGLTPFFWVAGTVTLIGVLYFLYFVLSNTSIDGIRMLINELFSKLMLKVIICFGSAGVLCWIACTADNYVKAHMPTIISVPLDFILYVVIIWCGYFPFFISDYYDAFIDKFKSNN